MTHITKSEDRIIAAAIDGNHIYALVGIIRRLEEKLSDSRAKVDSLRRALASAENDLDYLRGQIQEINQ